MVTLSCRRTLLGDRLCAHGSGAMLQAASVAWSRPVVAKVSSSRRSWRRLEVDLMAVVVTSVHGCPVDQPAFKAWWGSDTGQSPFLTKTKQLNRCGCRCIHAVNRPRAAPATNQSQSTDAAAAEHTQQQRTPACCCSRREARPRSGTYSSSPESDPVVVWPPDGAGSPLGPSVPW